MSKKHYKIMVCVADTLEEQRSLLSRLAVKLGFARIASDARKIIRSDINDYDLPTSYFVLATGYNFSHSPDLNASLLKMALMGLCVMVGTKRVPPELSYMVDIYHEDDL